MPDLSIVIPTCQRAGLLEQCLAAIAQTVCCDHEVIVVDGGGESATRAVLSRYADVWRERLVIITETRRQGFVRAVNAGFAAARGKYLTWLNDDARVRPAALDRALDQLIHAKPDVGLLAMFHAWRGSRNVAYETIIGGKTYRLLHVRGTLYANFGMGAQPTFARLGFFDPRYYFNGADPDFSLKVWNAHLRVEPAYGTAIDHEEHADDRRAHDAARALRDNALLFETWDLPAKNPWKNEFDPQRPCTLSTVAKLRQPA